MLSYGIKAASWKVYQEDAHDAMDHTITKTRLKHLLADQIYVDRLHEAVLRTNTIVQQAYFILKYKVQNDFDNLGGDDFFDHDIASALSREFQCPDLFGNAIAAVAPTTVGRPFGAARRAKIKEFITLRDELRDAQAWPQASPSPVNLSYVLYYSEGEMTTAYKNNVWMHFTKYVGAYARKLFQDAAVAEHGVERWRFVPSNVKKVVRRDVARCRQYAVFGSGDLPVGTVPSGLMEMLERMVPPLADPPTQRAYDLKTRWYRYIPYMIFINRHLQALDVKMYSPLCLRTAFIPKHIHIDTQGLLDILLQDNDEAIGLKMLVEERLGYDLPGVKGKNDFNKDVYSLVDRKDVAALDKHSPGHLRNSLWMELTKLGADSHLPLRQRGLRFNNMISTDGYSVSAHYVREDKVGLTKFNMDEDDREVAKDAKKAKKDAKKSEFAYVQDLPVATKSELLSKDTMLLAADPGKGNILVVTRVVSDHDGAPRKYPIVQLSAVQRRMESSQSRNAEERSKLIGKPTKDGHFTYADLQVAMGEDGASHKSCDNERYGAYLQKRYGYEGAQLDELYQATIFRRQAFRVFCGRKSSDDTFIDRLIKTFKTEECKRVAIAYGNWGLNPNLKHSPPTPGIGFRRHVHRRFPTYTVCEKSTSSVCFDCEHRGLNEWTKPVKGANGEELPRDVHQLLRCQNAKCSRWWSRDVLGALNIGKQCLHILQHGCHAPCFSLHNH